MRRRVEIARGLVHEPRIFFLDEPTTGLDPGLARRRVGDARSASRSERDLTVLLTTHYMDEADKLCDRIAIVDHGELKALDSPMKLKASIPGRNVLEVSFARCRRRTGSSALQALPAVEGVDRSRTTCSASPRPTARPRPRALIDAAHGSRRRRRSRCRSRARRWTTCSCTTPDGRCATRCRTRRRWTAPS